MIPCSCSFYLPHAFSSHDPLHFSAHYISFFKILHVNFFSIFLIPSFLSFLFVHYFIFLVDETLTLISPMLNLVFCLHPASAAYDLFSLGGWERARRTFAITAQVRVSSTSLHVHLHISTFTLISHFQRFLSYTLHIRSRSDTHPLVHMRFVSSSYILTRSFHFCLASWTMLARDR